MRKVLFTVLILLLVFAACGGHKKVPLTEDQKEFAGKWMATDGNWVRISLAGGGDFKMDNSNVDGGTATLTDNKLEIGLFGINKEWQITKNPYEKENGDMAIELDGIEYVKTNN